MQSKTTQRILIKTLGLALAGLIAACNNTPSGDTDMWVPEDMSMPGSGQDLTTTGGGDMAKPIMSFFISSRTGSGNLGGLAGADTICQTLAAAAGAGSRTWAAYLSATGVNAIDRIGQGPWYNQKGVKVADNLTDLHSANVAIAKVTGIDEKGVQIKGVGDTPNEHDILTGSTAAGVADATTRCGDWTSANAGTANVGHFDKMGGGANNWNFAHASSGCSVAQLQGSGGAGRIYCFAKD